MTLTRLMSWTLLAAIGFALLPAGAGAQDREKERPFPSKGSSFNEVKKYQENPRIIAGELEKARKSMQAFAKYHADFISHPLVYKVIQDPSKVPQGMYLRELSIEDRIYELGRYLDEPHPTNRSSFDRTQLRITGEDVDFIRELGKALDDALIKVVNENPDRLIKINAMRMYASVCKTGAAAHWPTVTKLLADPKTRTEIKVYALQAAANLLWAFDPEDYGSRRHSIGSKKPLIAADQEIGALVKAVEDCVTTPKMLVPDFPDGDLAKVSPSQIEVLRYARREAIRALAEVRFATLPGPGGKGEMLYPAFTLARVCMLDPALGPTPTPSECGEAVIGLANMAPVWAGKPVPSFNADAVAIAVATGIIHFSTPRAANPSDKSLPWLGYATRMSDALQAWAPIFSFLHDPTKPNPADAQKAPPMIHELVTRAQASILSPILSKSGNLNLQGLRDFVKTESAKPNAGILFTNVPATALPGIQKE